MSGRRSVCYRYDERGVRKAVLCGSARSRLQLVKGIATLALLAAGAIGLLYVVVQSFFGVNIFDSRNKWVAVAWSLFVGVLLLSTASYVARYGFVGVGKGRADGREV